MFSSVSSTHTYTGPSSEINFFLDDENALTVTINTPRLSITSVVPSEWESYYIHLYNDPEVMKKLADGQTRPKEKVQQRIENIWAKRWKENIPYSQFTVRKSDTEDLLGCVVLAPEDIPGQAEVSYAFKQNCWGKGFGTEAVTPVVKEYGPATVQEGYVIKAKPLKTITATARPDNPASVKILEKLGMHKIKEEEKYGNLRYHYSINVNTF